MDDRSVNSKIIDSEIIQKAVETHYTPGHLLDKITQALSRSGKDIEKISEEDLAPIEDFHIRGREATKELVEQLPIKELSKVIDIGCGIGGTSRYIASRHKCKVTAIDLSEEFIHTATELSRIVGLQDLIKFQRSDATALPFENNEFDIAITQHVQMNIEDKEKFILEVNRVLKKGGTFAFYDIFQGNFGSLYYPVPWAENEQISFLANWNSYKGILESAGFREMYEEDMTTPGLNWFKAMMENSGKEGYILEVMQSVMGKSAKESMGNAGRNMKEGKIRVVKAIFKKK
ncbi:MAG: class I SAM-dependent methyltransferase [Clostridiales bacterium]